MQEIMMEPVTDETGHTYCLNCITKWVSQHRVNFVHVVTGVRMDVRVYKVFKNHALQSVIDVFTSKNLVVSVKRKADEDVVETEDVAPATASSPPPAISPDAFQPWRGGRQRRAAITHNNC